MALFDVGSLEEMEESKPVKVQAGETDILLIRRGQEVTALAHACPHFGLPLSKGQLDGDRLICAFHHACFDTRTGRQTEPPGHGDLRRYEVEIRGGRVRVEIPDDAVPHPAPAFVRRGSDGRRFVTVGAGAAADAATATLRESGFEGEIEMIAPERSAPYDRTLLSKAVLAGGEGPRNLVISSPETLAARDIAMTQGHVVALDPQARCLHLDDGSRREFDALLIAPGGQARNLGIPGEDLVGVHTLRSRDDGERLARAAGSARRVVIVGGGFIGLEAALSLAKRGLDVVVAMRDEVPLARIVGERVGRAIRAEHEAAGVTFRTGVTAEAFTGNGVLKTVELDDKSTLEADLAIVAVGVRPATADMDGLEPDGDGGITTSTDLSVPGMPGVFVAGDAARVPTPWGNVRIEHWRVARQHGQRAARAMLGESPREDIGVPFFWTALKRQYRYLGHAEGWDDIVMDGDPASGPFLASYVKGGRTMAMMGAGRDADLARAHLAMIRNGGPLPA